MGFKEVMAKIGHLGMPGDPSPWDELSFGKKVMAFLQIPMIVLGILSILILVLEVSGL